MKKQLFFRVLPLLLTCLFIGSVHAQTVFEEDVHYFSIIPEQPGAEGERAQVIEFFWYACPHCYKLEPNLNAWLGKKPENVEFVRIPAMFKRADVVLHAKTYYALTLMGVEEELNVSIFDAIHEQNNRLATPEAMESFLAEKGVDLDAYRKAMKSFAVQTQARRAEVLANRFDIRGVPAFVVDGKFRTSGLEGETQMQVIDYLIDKVVTEKRAGKQ
ncbi:MAG: thiol:disulfide interchange protein DsbA/DsbL [Sedimenticola sp.]|nr:thiol:disulfide interchange protein DsbA/DsbL [Sedimenticola sp.]